MYFYAVTGKQKVKTVVETTDDDGEVTPVTSVTEVDCKVVITQKQANEYVKNDTYPVYAVYDDGTEELMDLYSDDDPPEELVGGLEEPADEVTGTPLVAVTEQIVTVPRTTTQESDYRLTASFTPTKTGYQLLGVCGYRVIGTTTILPFRIEKEGNVVNVGLRNVGATHVDSVDVKVCLLWLLEVSETDTGDLSDE